MLATTIAQLLTVARDAGQALGTVAVKHAEHAATAAQGAGSPPAPGARK